MGEQTQTDADFLILLGRRVRDLRRRLGFTRKQLATLSCISERYIAQLEGGKGNVSIILLRRVSAAMDKDVGDLITSEEAPPDWSIICNLISNATPLQIAQVKETLSGNRTTLGRDPAGVALIGLRGAGKSTLGKLLAEVVGWPFFELNKEIERIYGISVAEIMALYGQDGFRRMEQGALTKVLSGTRPIVLATGGSIVSEPVTFDMLLSSFFTVWLRAKPEEHMARVRNQGDMRPMESNRSDMLELRTILLSREPLYARASAQIDTTDLTIEKAAARLFNAVAPIIAAKGQG